MKTFAIIAVVIGGLPLVIYPFVLLADVMSLAAPQSGKSSPLLTLVARAFQWTSLAYPAVYLPCVTMTCSLLKKADEKAALGISVIPLGYLVVVIALFYAWMIVEKRG